MRTKTMKRLTNRVMAGILTAAMLIAGVAVVPKTVEAAEGDVITVGEIKYVAMSKSTFEGHYNQSPKTAPSYSDSEVEGYIFGGWYTEAKNGAAIAEEDTVSTDTVYAKFVPAYVLSMKGQNGTMDSSDNTTMRLVSSVDSLDYKVVGYDILIDNDEGRKITDAETTKVYNTLKVVGVKEPYTPSQVFGSSSKYFITWKIYNIPTTAEAQATKVYVRPYWITKDGTKVNGLAKYLHVEDGINGYVNVPINLSTGEDVAAGVLTMDYSAIATDYELHAVEYGRVFDEMDYAPSGNTIKFVGNVSTISENEKADDLYACVRFKKKDSGEAITIGKNSLLTFKVDGEDFCDNAENPCNGFDAWDVKY